jgi:hypothetical protein
VVKRLLPRRRGNFLIEIIARDNEQVMIVAEHTILGLVLNKTLEVELGAAETQAKEIMAEILDFIWECNAEKRDPKADQNAKDD